MSGKRYTEEFKIEAVKQVTERGHAAADVAARLGVSAYSLYQWIKRYSVPESERRAAQNQQDEIRRLKAELRRVTEERDILKKAAVGSMGHRNIICSNLDMEDGVYGTNGAPCAFCISEGGTVAKMESRTIIK